MLERTALPDVTDADLQSVPLERAHTIPASWYTDARFHKLDQECIFSRHWQIVAHTSQLKNPGDVLVDSVAGRPIIIVLGRDRQIRAFYNVCRHRGGPLAMQNGNSNVLQCKYHGWTYTLEGSLRGAPHFDGVASFACKDYGLIPVPLECWEGLIFVRLSAEGPALSDYMTGIADRISPISVKEKQFYSRAEYRVHCNWKVYTDNYLEGYHVPYVHPELCKLYDYKNYKTDVSQFHTLQYAPLQTSGEAYYFWIFPNVMLNILPGRLQTNSVVPITCDETLVVFDYYYDDISSPQALKMIQNDLEYSDRIQQEDIEICEHVQRGLGSGVYDRGRFSVQFEEAVYRFQTLIKETYRDWIAARL